jgi:DNA-directed RNA polymerase specialized sigma54-like protein
MMTLEQVQKKLAIMNLSAVARETGLEYMQVWKLVNDKYASTPYDVVKTLSDYLESV